MDDLLAHCNEQRREKDLLTIEQMLALKGIIIYDPFSTLISNKAALGAGTQIYPNCMILCSQGGSVALGEDNRLYPSTVIQAQAGSIQIGAGNQCGPGGFTARVLDAGEYLSIGDHGRYNQGANIQADCRLGSGSQVLGPIAVVSCELAPGGSFQDPDPNKRGGVLKGAGRANGLNVGAGEVIQAFGVFAQAAVERQIAHHPPGT